MVKLIFITIFFIGYLSAYAKNPTDGTISIRQDWGQLPQNISHYDVLLSVPNCDLIGKEANMIVDEHTYKAIIFDCAGEASHEWMIENKIAAEVDYYFWMENPELVGSEKEIQIYINKE